VWAAVGDADGQRRVASVLGDVARGARRHLEAIDRDVVGVGVALPGAGEDAHPDPCRTLRVAFFTTPSSSEAVWPTRCSKKRSAWSARVATAVPRTRSRAPPPNANRSRKKRSGLSVESIAICYQTAPDRARRESATRRRHPASACAIAALHTKRLTRQTAVMDSAGRAAS
jgi:hypothetical protein